MYCALLVALVARHATGRDMKGKNVHNDRHDDEISAKTIEIETVVEELEGPGYQTLCRERNQL
jgi:hypothetical protein